MQKKHISILFFFITVFMSAQCAMCKAVVESGDAEMAKGLNNGITYLMVVPYLLIGALLFYIYKHRKKNKN